MKKDTAELTIDTSGDGLHNRGYRPYGFGAPLRETLAASILRLSKWTPDRPLADPFCGTGTIPIEGAMLGRSIAPGLNRSFAAEEWPQAPKQIWDRAREKARDLATALPLEILASDMDFRAVNGSRINAEKAGVADAIVFQKKPVQEFSSRKKFGVLVTSPPYGERLGDIKEAEELYKELGARFGGLDTWSLFILTAHEKFGAFFGRTPDKNRKLYNGKIQCRLNMYYGPFPPRKRGPLPETGGGPSPSENEPAL